MTIFNSLLKNSQSALLKVLLNMPIIGQMMTDIRNGRDSALGYFGLNIAMLWLIAGFTWGLTGVLAGAYFLLPCYFVILLTMMRS